MSGRILADAWAAFAEEYSVDLPAAELLARCAFLNGVMAVFNRHPGAEDWEELSREMLAFAREIEQLRARSSRS